MTRTRISEAGLKPEPAQRLRAALACLAGEGLRTSLSRWSGLRCDLLVADVDDGYGYYASQALLRHGGRLLALSAVIPQVRGARETLSTHASQARLVEALRPLLVACHPAPQASPQHPATASLLARLRDAGDDVLARRGPLLVRLRRRASRILAASQRDLIAARALVLDDQWQLDAFSTQAADAGALRVGFSLDAFLIGACIATESRLPMLPGSDFRLAVWPDVARLGEHPEVLRVVALLLRAPMPAARLVARSGCTPSRVNALLWALHAAGLLDSDAERPAAPSSWMHARAAVLGDALQRLRRRFGMGLP